MYLFAQKIATLYPSYTVKYYLWDNSTLAYGTATIIQVGTGSNTLHIWNASVAGHNIYYHILNNFTAQVVTPNPDLVFISHGHNEGNITTDETKIITKARYYLLPQYILSAVPEASIMMIAQNPATVDDYQKLRAEMIREVAETCGYGYVNVHDAFLAVANWDTELMADTVHPNSTGQQVWLNEVMRHFNYAPNIQPIKQLPSSLLSQITNLLVNGDFSSFDSDVPDNWTKGSTETLSKDSTNFETGTYGLKIVSGAAASGFIYQRVDTANPNTPISLYRGKWVTLAVRLRKPTGQPTTAGRISLYDGINTVTSRASYAGNGDFYWDMISLKVSSSATMLRAYIYADSSNTGNIEITVDRAILCFGKLPKDIF